MNWLFIHGIIAPLVGTPTVLVNGMMYLYAPHMADLKQMIENARSRAGAH
jgi:hypothetical protein